MYAHKRLLSVLSIDRGAHTCSLTTLTPPQVENVNLYATKYEEEFQRFLPTFATAVWELLKASGTHDYSSMYTHIHAPRGSVIKSWHLSHGPKPKPTGTSWAVPKYDALVTVSMRFLASLASKRMHFELFNNPTL